jgi:SAM-dependent methyltransferase
VLRDRGASGKRFPLNTTATEQDVVTHFTARAERYDHSSHWVSDDELADRVMRLLSFEPQHRVLDVACGTGLWARTFRQRGATVVGVDITPAMYRRGREALSATIEAPAENLPFVDGCFDIVTTRQGLQFMDAARATVEMARVTRPGGHVCLVQLCAYDQTDRDEFFEILRLRNPCRRNFFIRQDLADLLTVAGLRDVKVHDYVSTEDVGCWGDNGAIDEVRQQKLKAVYLHASKAFRALHLVGSASDQRILDKMLFGIAIGAK